MTHDQETHALRSLVANLLEGDVPVPTADGYFWYGSDEMSVPRYKGHQLTLDEIEILGTFL